MQTHNIHKTQQQFHEWLKSNRNCWIIELLFMNNYESFTIDSLDNQNSMNAWNRVIIVDLLNLFMNNYESFTIDSLDTRNSMNGWNGVIIVDVLNFWFMNNYESFTIDSLDVIQITLCIPWMIGAIAISFNYHWHIG